MQTRQFFIRTNLFYQKRSNVTWVHANHLLKFTQINKSSQAILILFVRLFRSLTTSLACNEFNIEFNWKLAHILFTRFLLFCIFFWSVLLKAWITFNQLSFIHFHPMFQSVVQNQRQKMQTQNLLKIISLVNRYAIAHKHSHFERRCIVFFCWVNVTIFLEEFWRIQKAICISIDATWVK